MKNEDEEWKTSGSHSSLRICFSPISLNLMMTECFQALEEQILPKCRLYLKLKISVQVLHEEPKDG